MRNPPTLFSGWSSENSTGTQNGSSQENSQISQAEGRGEIQLAVQGTEDQIRPGATSRKMGEVEIHETVSENQKALCVCQGDLHFSRAL